MSTKENGKMTILMERLYSKEQMGTFMRVNGKMIKFMDMECLLEATGISTVENGMMIKCTERG